MSLALESIIYNITWHSWIFYEKKKRNSKRRSGRGRMDYSHYYSHFFYETLL